MTILNLLLHLNYCIIGNRVTVEAEHIIKHLTLESQTVLDPMMDTGTNGLAALNLGRKFVGIEINPATFEIARSNIGNINNR